MDGITYGTHSLGPILQWFGAGDRVERVACAGSGRQYVDPRGDLYENQATGVMLCQMASGGLAKIRVDMLSDRPHAMSNYQLQGTDGAYESSRGDGDPGRVWLRAKHAPEQWGRLHELEGAYLPDWYWRGLELANRAGHGGGDYFEIVDFVNAMTGVAPCPIGIHEAMDMTLPGLVSQASVAASGAWLTVPDSRTW